MSLARRATPARRPRAGSPRTAGTITAGATKATSGDLAFTIQGTDGASLRILADASAGLDTGDAAQGRDRDADGHRRPARVPQGRPRRLPALGPRPRATSIVKPAAVARRPARPPSPSASPGVAPLVTVAAAIRREGRTVTVEGTVTIDRTLLDASGRRAVVEDGTGAIELYLPEADASIRAGVRIRATGEVGRAWGAPRLRVEAFRVIGQRAPVVRDLRVAPTAATEWRLVRVRGTIEDVHRSGDRWTAELVVGRPAHPARRAARQRRSTAAQVVEGRQRHGHRDREAPVSDGDRPAVRRGAARDAATWTLARRPDQRRPPRRGARTRRESGAPPPARGRVRRRPIPPRTRRSRMSHWPTSGTGSGRPCGSAGW